MPRATRPDAALAALLLTAARQDHVITARDVMAARLPQAALCWSGRGPRPPCSPSAARWPARAARPARTAPAACHCPAVRRWSCPSAGRCTSAGTSSRTPPPWPRTTSSGSAACRGRQGCGRWSTSCRPWAGSTPWRCWTQRCARGWSMRPAWRGRRSRRPAGGARSPSRTSGRWPTPARRARWRAGCGCAAPRAAPRRRSCRCCCATSTATSSRAATSGFRSRSRPGPGCLVLEADGQAVHGTPEALYPDRWRADAIVALGHDVIRCTWADALDPHRVPAVVRAALWGRRPGPAAEGRTAGRERAGAQPKGRAARTAGHQAPHHAAGSSASAARARNSSVR